MVDLDRRGLIAGVGALFLAAPAIVRAASLMPISARNIPIKSASGWFNDFQSFDSLMAEEYTYFVFDSSMEAVVEVGRARYEKGHIIRRTEVYG